MIISHVHSQAIIVDDCFGCDSKVGLNKLAEIQMKSMVCFT